VLDVGTPPPTADEALRQNQYDLKRSGEDPFRALIGDRFESLHNVHRSYLSPKLKGPRMRYVTADWRELSRIDTDGFDPVQSFATGGLANAWGAGAYRFTDAELHDFPIRRADLEPFYDDLTAHIGIAGTDDDLAPYLGSAAGCQPAHPQNRLGRHLAAAYQRHRAHFHRRGIRIGAPRLAVLSRDHRGRAAYDHQGLEFFQGHIPAIYNPAFTLAELVRDRVVEHRTGMLAERFETRADGVLVAARDVRTDAQHTFTARRLVLAAGAVGSASLVLRSRADTTTRLPLLDNPISYVPLVAWRLVGQGVETASLPLQSTLVCEDGDDPCPVFGSFYGVSATLWNDLLFDLPLAARDNIRMLKFLLPALCVVQLFHPDRPRAENHLKIDETGRLQLNYRKRAFGAIERRVLGAFRRIGYLGLPGLCKYPDPGNSFHYAGCLPMRAQPGPYECDADGRLGGDPRVHVADAATFPSLPSKNLTFTIMANAARIGTRVREGLAR